MIKFSLPHRTFKLSSIIQQAEGCGDLPLSCYYKITLALSIEGVSEDHLSMRDGVPHRTYPGTSAQRMG